MRAMSVLGNAKSKSHRKTHPVESDGTGRMFMHLTRGDLRWEIGAGVSRGRSSEEARRKTGRAKGRRTNERAEDSRLREKGGKTSEIRRALQQRQPPTGARAWNIAGLRWERPERMTSPWHRAEGGQTSKCSMK